MPVVNTNNVDPDQMLRSAASDQGQQCLPMSHLMDARHKWVKARMIASAADSFDDFRSDLVAFGINQEILILLNSQMTTLLELLKRKRCFLEGVSIRFNKITVRY